MVIVEGLLKEIRRVTQDGHVHGVRGQELGYLSVVKAHVVTDDVETVSGLVVLHLGAPKGRRVEEVIAPVRESKFKKMLFTESKTDQYFLRYRQLLIALSHV